MRRYDEEEKLLQKQYEIVEQLLRKKRGRSAYREPKMVRQMLKKQCRQRRKRRSRFPFNLLEMIIEAPLRWIEAGLRVVLIRLEVKVRRRRIQKARARNGR